MQPGTARRLAASAFLILFAIGSALGQNSGRTVRVGITAGSNWANFSRDSTSSSAHRGSVGGLQFVVPVSPRFSIQAEVLYTMKGAEERVPLSEAIFSMRYLEIPVLVRVDIPAFTHLHPLLYAGPAVSFQRACHLHAVDHDPFGSNAVQTIDRDCDQLHTASGAPAKFNKVDGGVVAGFGLAATGWAGASLVIAGRLDASFGYVTENTAGDAKNRVLSLVAGLEVPLKRP